MENASNCTMAAQIMLQPTRAELEVGGEGLTPESTSRPREGGTVDGERTGAGAGSGDTGVGGDEGGS